MRRRTFPRTFGSHASKASGVVIPSGYAMTSASTGRGVAGLHAIAVASSERTRGATRSTCVTPRFQPSQVP